ncbi:MAG TPA: OmpA family protein [Anaeromyxobacteraceae bacterium]|nr:OmpA family protein [Anaeromyxobacteraceae bacterium]
MRGGKFKGKGHRVEREDDSNPLHDASWLYSYADLMTQLLIFSILMLAVLGLKELNPELLKKTEQAKAEAAKAAELAKAVDELQAYVKKQDLGDAMVIDRSADRMVIRMKSAILFKEGQAVLAPAALAIIDGLVPTLSRTPNKLRIEGHTDDVPIATEAFPSNWELSTARAISVAGRLEAGGVDRARLSVAGYAEFHPLVANESADQRAQNRRVEIVVLGG